MVSNSEMLNILPNYLVITLEEKKKHKRTQKAIINLRNMRLPKVNGISIAIGLEDLLSSLAYTSLLRKELKKKKKTAVSKSIDYVHILEYCSQSLSFLKELVSSYTDT